MLLIIETLLLILAALGQDHRAAAEGEIPLSMALNSFDDQYDGCTKDMEKLVKTVYLRKELDESGDFREAWKAGEEKFKEKRDNMAREYLIAMYVYTSETREYSVYRDFNEAVRKYEDKTFAWHSLHFLLTKALQIVKKQQNAHFVTIYRGTKSKFLGKEGTTFRFGSFTSFSLNKGIAQGFARIHARNSETGHCFEINDYEGAEVSKYSEYPGEEEVLIPPYEKFEVTAIRTNDWCNKVFVLKSTGIESNLNCALIKKKTNVISNLFGCCGKG